MSAFKRKRRTMEIQDDPTVPSKRKRDLNSEEMDASQVSDSPSTVLFELDISNSMNIPGDKNSIKVERSQDDAAYISCNNAEENQLDIKDPNLSIRSVLNASRFSARGTPGNTSVIKMEKNGEAHHHNSRNNAVEEAQHHNSRNNAVEEAHNSFNNDGEAHNSHVNDGEAHNSHVNDEETEKQLDIVDVSVNDSVLNETVEEAQPKKKKKKKKKHLDENELENDVIADNVQDNVEEIQQEQIEDVESSQKKKKKKKKKHRDEESQAEEQDQQTNEEPVDTSPPKKRKKKKENDVSQLELETEGTVDISPKKRKKKKEKGNELENEAVETVEKQNKKENYSTKLLDTEGELSIADIKRMFEDIREKISEQKTFHAKRFWANYKFPPFSTDQCKIAYEKVMTKVQKRRTIVELVDAAEKILTNNPAIFLGENRNVKPTTPLKVYVQDHFQKIVDKYPNHRPIQRLNKLGRKWCKLSDRKKLKYFDLALLERPKYLETLKICRKVEPLLISKPTLNRSEWLLKDKLAGLPDPPVRNGFGYFLQSGYSLYPDMPYTKKLQLLAADYKTLPVEVKEKYHLQHVEMKKQYNESLNKYLSTLNPIELEDRGHHTLNKEQKLIKKRTKASSVQNKPPATGYALFFRELREEVAGDYPGIINQLQVSEKWRALKEEERVEYNRRRLVIYSEWLNSLKEKVNHFFDETKNACMISREKQLLKSIDSVIVIDEDPQTEEPQTEKSSNDA